MIIGDFFVNVIFLVNFAAFKFDKTYEMIFTPFKLYIACHKVYDIFDALEMGSSRETFRHASRN